MKTQHETTHPLRSRPTVSWSRLLFLVLLVASVFSIACTENEPPKTGECTLNSDCKSIAQICKSEKCVTATCKGNGDCRSGAYCNLDKGTCQKEPFFACKENADCKDNATVCVDGKCIPGTRCAGDTDCKDPAKPRCENTQCTVGEKCSKDEHCKIATRSVCISGRCARCSENKDCTDSVRSECFDGKCIAPKPECAKNEDCTDESKPVCSGGKCVVDNGKAEGETCEKTFNCKVNLRCFRVDRDAKLGVCRKLCDIYKGDCASEKACFPLESGKEGVCVPKNNGKKEGEACDKANPCERDLRCLTWKGKDICVRPCDPKNPACGTGEECFAIRKGKESCVSKREPCGVGRPCSNDKDFCENGLCTPPPSCDDIKCKDTEVCENGSCRPRKCPDEKDCKPWESCLNGVCSPKQHVDPPCKVCTTNTDCGPGGVCLRLESGGKSYCFESCASAACGDTKNFYCRTISYNNGRSCTSDSTCKIFGQEYSCVQGTCSVENAKHCWPRIGTCNNKCKSVTCNPPQVCVPSAGTCVTTGKKACETCKYNEECGGVRDLCISFNNGRSYCATDCAKAGSSCPLKQRCYPLSDGINRQCLPSSSPENGCTP